jgi:tetratricopeptide (TPR) repeat protein
MSPLYKVQVRYAQYYLNLLEQLNSLFKSGRASTQKAIEQFDTEFSQISQAQNWSASVFRDPNYVEAIWLCVDYPGAGLELLSLRLPLVTWIDWLETAFEADQMHDEKDSIADYLLNTLGGAYESAGRFEDASTCFKNALRVALRLENRVTEGLSLGNLGLICSRYGQSEDSLEHYRYALAIAQENKDTALEMDWLNLIAVEYGHLGKWEEEISIFKSILQMARKERDEEQELLALTNLGGAYCSRGHYKRALQQHKKAYTLAEKLKSHRWTGVICADIAEVYHRLGEFDDSKKWVSQAVAILKKDDL